MRKISLALLLAGLVAGCNNPAAQTAALNCADAVTGNVLVVAATPDPAAAKAVNAAMTATADMATNPACQAALAAVNAAAAPAAAPSK
jgi:hypothetical protein